MTQNWKNIVFNICLTLNCLLLFLLLFGAGMKVPVLLQVAGRMHPLILHFPIVLLILAFVWELFIPQKDHATIAEAGDWLLLSAAFTAVLAALMGLFLSREAGYDPDTIAWHKWTGVMIALISVIWFAFRNNVRKRRFFVVATGGISMIGIILAGHQGANITHGENFLLAPVIPEKKKRDVLFEDAITYTHLVVPILEEKCMGCHNSRKAKGELIMETEELLVKGGKNGKLWDSTASGFGLMMQRLHLPLQEKKHMPPKGKSQLTDNEMAALYYWIKSGASFTQKIADLPATDTLRIVAADFFNTLEGDNYDFAAADDATINKLNNEYRVLHPLAQNSPALDVTFFGASFFKAEQLKELEKVKNQVVSLNLNRMPVKDEDLKYIAAFKNLRRLNLSFTEITGSGLKELRTLKDLRQLSLSGNKLKSVELEMLGGLEKLSTVYLWKTGVNDPDITSLKKKFPDTQLETGFRGIQLLPV